MTINFPSSPTNGQLYSYGQSTWQWTGEYWSVYSAQTGYVTSVSDTGSGNSVINSLNSNNLLLKTFSGDSNVIITDTGNQLNFTLTGVGNGKLVFNNNTLLSGTTTAVNLSASTLNLYTLPTNNNLNTDILTRNSSNGNIETTTVSSLMINGKVLGLTQIMYTF